MLNVKEPVVLSLYRKKPKFQKEVKERKMEKEFSHNMPYYVVVDNENYKNNIKKLTPLQASELLKKSESIIDYCVSLKEYCKDQAVLEGAKFDGFEIKETTRNTRVWKDKEKAEQDLTMLLGDEAYEQSEKKLISPHKAEQKGLRSFVSKNVVSFVSSRKEELAPTSASSKGALSQFSDSLDPEEIQALIGL